MTLARTLREVKRLHPKMDHDTAVETAYRWMEDAQLERDLHEDTYDLRDHYPLEYWTERGDA